MAAYYKKHPVYTMLQGARFRAKQKGIPCTITERDIVIPVRCPVLGIPLVIGSGPGGSEASPSLDRMIPSLGYIPGNVAVISKRANRLKCDCTDPTELRAVADYIERVFTGR